MTAKIDAAVDCGKGKKMDWLLRRIWTTAIVGMFQVCGVHAAEKVRVGETAELIPLVAGKPYLHVIHEGRSVKVQRVQDPDYELKGYFAKTGRKCPPFCIQPATPDSSVGTIGEVELFDFMENKLRDGSGVLIDARTGSWFRKGTIPGSVNYPFTLFGKDGNAPELVAALKSFGAEQRGEVGATEKLLEDWGWSDARHKTEDWDFAKAKDLVLWCNGPACGQSPRAIRGLLDVGYPGEKISYYRGGMQMWQLWGLTTVVPRQ
jgi:rhodanese-related sulfurtransferase